MPLIASKNIKFMLGQPRLATAPADLTALEANWTFRSSPSSLISAMKRIRMAVQRCPAPAFMTLKPVAPRDRWIAYFIYLPDGVLTPAHRFTLCRLREDASSGTMIICATPNASEIPGELVDMADALYWKSLPGFDFSAYTLAIDEISKISPGADLLLINDSVFGPFVSLASIWSQMRWNFTGFTASGQVKNHIQSYAFCIKGVDRNKRVVLSKIFNRSFAYDNYQSVVARQELQMAEEAARTMPVGALWYAEPTACADPSIFAALPLVKAGFPFLKRALLTKHAGVYPKDEIIEILRLMHHPT
jgi:lipopolysaccharide biosynthesis protein